ncbi:pilin [Stenotrophomonas sp. 24(2023)]|uniref:pilin n=1 Tax=Stenotrophomonas sp. 24(2023) TaxID=3068324 RepID=UPI0027DF262C|nr:pilin [Stenotrophomonas sp. 24(2023)]WMJ70659.1 GYF domain-containing protein [Stenotrophomonas sp. 24(2023)]
MSEWFHAEGNRQQGPVPAGQLVELFRSNQVSLDTLVWRDGMAQWQPLRAVVDELGLIVPAVDAQPPLPPAPPAPPSLPDTPYASPAPPAPASAAPAKSGLSSGAIIAIVIGGVLLLLIAVLGILAAIALPAYQEYTVRAKVAGAVATLGPLKAQVEEFTLQNGRCPNENDAGFPAPGDFTSNGLATVNIGRFESGHCGIEAALAVPGEPIDGDLLWLEYDREGNRWECSGESPDKVLPLQCRG